MVFFTELERKNFLFVWKHKRPQIVKAILKENNKIKQKKVREESYSLTSEYTTKTESSKQHSSATKTEIYTNGTGQKALKYTREPMINESTTKGVRIYNVKKTVSSISGAGETGPVKE